jgi:EAL domain-containing protein (putative c-di-GMP-specific phosphodiesterase class I)
VLEVTEHSTIEDYDAIASVLAPLRKRGLRLAVDDAGAGYASFRHILQLKPDIIKLDRSLISGLNANRDQLALAAALVSFAEKTGIKVVAEGVETPEELKALQTLNVNKAQGYLLGRPTPLRDITG